MYACYKILLLVLLLLYTMSSCNLKEFSIGLNATGIKKNEQKSHQLFSNTKQMNLKEQHSFGFKKPCISTDKGLCLILNMYTDQKHQMGTTKPGMLNSKSGGAYNVYIYLGKK